MSEPDKHFAPRSGSPRDTGSGSIGGALGGTGTGASDVSGGTGSGQSHVSSDDHAIDRGGSDAEGGFMPVDDHGEPGGWAVAIPVAESCQ